MKNLKKLSRENLKAVKGEGCVTIYHTTSCGVPASTCQSGWSGIRMMEWANTLEKNYC